MRSVPAGSASKRWTHTPGSPQPTWNASTTRSTRSNGPLTAGCEAFDQGDLITAENRLRIVAGHHYDDAIVYLVVTYRRMHRSELAKAWLVIAEDDGFAEADVDRVLAAVHATTQRCAPIG